MASLFSSVAMAPRDPILGLNEAFNADPSPNKVNLGVGVYYDDNGRLPVLACVKAAEKQRLEAAAARGYQPIEGPAAYLTAVQHLVFGADSALLKDKRIASVQTLGGTGGLKVGADFLKRTLPNAGVYISDPSWENHRALFESAGFTVGTYPYYDAASRGSNVDGMLATLQTLPSGSIVVLHACCHNPTGVDITGAQWDRVVTVCKERGLVPFLDMAYQGFGAGIEEDGVAVRKFAAAGIDFVVSNSFSKSFSLYGERVGALHIVCESADEAARVLSQLKRVVRTNYSTPPTHGGAVVAQVLATSELRAMWERELGEMRDRIKQMRHALVERLAAKGVKADLSYMVRQCGMFSYSGLNADQVERLRAEFGVYAVSSGRICVAALNPRNIDYVTTAVAKVW